ncbi:LbetaH domain-containing protein [Mesorhizobium sp. A556]
MTSRFTGFSRALENANPPKLGGQTFGLRHRALRLCWMICWTLFARWTPPQMNGLRRALLQLFGAQIHPTARIRSSARIWWPGNLVVGAHASLGPGVICYNIARIVVRDFADVSQRAHLCTGTHNIDDPDFRLIAKPIMIGQQAWIAAEAFVGPGVTVGCGAVLGARGVAFRDLDDWTVYAGNPAKPIRKRRFSERPDLRLKGER